MTKEKDSSESGNWWFSRYDYDYRSQDRSKTSGSRGWLSKLGGYDSDNFSYSNWYGYSKEKTNESAFQGLLNQLQISANLIGSDESNSVNVRWSNGEDKNGSKKDCIFLSPDNLIDGTSNISEENVDAITGKVYLASVLRETVDKGAYNVAQNARVKGCESEIHRGAVRLWESIETSIARQKLMQDWGGFGSYIASDAERSSASKEDVQRYVNSTVDEPSVDGVTMAIAWNLLNPNDTIRIPSCYDACIDSASDILSEEVEAKSRFRSSFTIATKLSSLLPPKKGGKKNSKGGEADGEDTPKVCDGALLGEKVKNTTNTDLSEQKSEDDGEENSSVSIGYNGELRDTSPDNFLAMSSTPKDKTLFNTLVKNNSSSIRAIKNSLLFRNNDIRLPSFGHRAGDIDENSLHKISLKDDRIMMRRDDIQDKKIAICLLVDESGSMSGSRIESARDVAISLAEGMRGISGISVSIYGHTAEEGDSDHCMVREYYSPRVTDMSACMQMKGRSENHDGFAIQHTANSFNKDYGSYDRKIMFVISDGQPAGTDYGGTKAFDHIRSVSASCNKALGIEVYGIGISEAYENAVGKKMYGENNFVVLNDISSSLQIMSRFIRQIAMCIKK